MSAIFKQVKNWLVVGTVVVLASVASWNTLVPNHHRFDLTNATSPASIGWTAPLQDVQYAGHGFPIFPAKEQINVKLPGMETYIEPNAWMVDIQTQHGLLSEFSVMSGNISEDELLQRVHQWANIWQIQLNPNDVQQWQRRNTRDLSPWIPFYLRRPGGIDLWLEVRPNGGSRPWCLLFKMYWNRPVPLGIPK